MIKEQIKSVRKQLDMTQEQVAKILGVSTPTISRYESGIIVPPADKFLKIMSLPESIAPQAQSQG